MAETAKMDIKAYETKKREAAAQVDEWFQRDPEHWRDKAKEVIAACLDPDLPSPIDDCRGSLNAKNQVVPPVFTDGERALRCYYLTAIILHDTTGGHTAIALDLWPKSGIPVVNRSGRSCLAKGRRLKRQSEVQVSLWDAARYVFHDLYGDKSDFFKAALRAVEKDLNPELPPVTSKAEPVYDLIHSLPENKALTRAEILDALANQKPPVDMSEETFKEVVKELKPYGLRNQPQRGYYFKKKP